MNHQLDELADSEEHVKTNLHQLEFEASQEEYRVVQVDEAGPAAGCRPTTNESNT